MKRMLIVGLVVALMSLVAVLAVPVFAHDPMEADSGTADQETWQAMHEACEEGEWEAMVEAAEEVHADLDYDSCHCDQYLNTEEGTPGSWGGMMGW